MTLDEIMAPLGAERFLNDHLGRAPLHLQGPPAKFQAVMNWDVLNRLLGATTIWSAQSMVVVIDKEPVAPATFCEPAPGRDGHTVLRPDPSRVKALLARGATLVLNDIDQLTPELSALARALEERLGGKVQANLYLSSKRRQGFRAHFDFHDVFAVHVMGEKTWMVFEGRADHPIKHPSFEGWPQERHEAAKGALWREVRLKPGDLLYLPRGQYHYALADDGACVHIAFGVTYPIGMDAVSYAFERLIAEAAGRQNLPRERGALKGRLAEIGAALARTLADERAVEDLLRFQAGFRWPRETYGLPGLVEEADTAFTVKGSGLRLVSQGGRHGLLREGTRQAVEVPARITPHLAWVLERERFTRKQLLSAFNSDTATQIDQLIVDLGRMAVIEPAA